MSDFKYRDIFWKNNTAAHMLSIKFLECIEDCFLTQTLDVPTRKEALLDMLLTDQENLLCNVLASDSLGCSNHYVVECEMLLSMMKVSTKTKALDFRGANFSSLRAQLAEIPWKASMEHKGISECWDFFKNTLLEVQKPFIPFIGQIYLAGDQLCGKRPGGPGRQQAQYESTVCCSGKESQQDGGLHQQGHHQQRQRRHYPTLLRTCQATPGILCSVLVLLSKKNVDRLERVQRRDTKMINGLGSLRKAESIWFVQLGEKKAQGRAYYYVTVFKGWLQRRWRLPFYKESHGKDEG
ncbi:rna-directed dna polymerase from mobile element jockey-like [Limosa lapponica baueri]|uniref:Rna-directed dna polymerase from mobile element jockey-like n=1 Tax=Limosa lapponica baueri TaxID=1758121 RepID=A0A2I0UTN2_LIMLA|nr:rna-directed dna polymerase from mobile element jockey-like [Limosa lapponica baueri]